MNFYRNNNFNNEGNDDNEFTGKVLQVIAPGILFYMIVFAAIIFFNTGCISQEGIDKIGEVVDKIEDYKDAQDAKEEQEKQEQQNQQDQVKPAEPSTPTVPSKPSTSDKADKADTSKFAELDFCWGGFNGKGATQVSNAQIADLKIGKGLSYRWVSGGCEALGAPNKTSPDYTLACLFCKIDGKWKGGKFDWISTSRVTRDFHNIETSYNGWDKNAISKATAYRFVIISRDGKRRTNVIEVSK